MSDEIAESQKEEVRRKKFLRSDEWPSTRTDVICDVVDSELASDN